MFLVKHNPKTYAMALADEAPMALAGTDSITGSACGRSNDSCGGSLHGFGSGCFDCLKGGCLDGLGSRGFDVLCGD